MNDFTNAPKGKLEFDIFIATSGNKRLTYGTSLFKAKDDTSKLWEPRQACIFNEKASEAALLKVLTDTIDSIVRRNPEQELVLNCITYADAIVIGANKNRHVWEANGFTNSLGGVVKHKELWEKLFALMDQYTITVGMPNGYSSTLKACINDAKKVVKDHPWRDDGLTFSDTLTFKEEQQFSMQRALENDRS